MKANTGDAINTKRNLAEEALRQSESQLTSIYNSLAEAIYYLSVEPDQQYRFLSVNSAFNKITGIPADQVIGKTVNEIFPEQSLNIALEKYSIAVIEKRIIHWEATSDYTAGCNTFG